MIKAVIFDKDGTIVDSEDFHTRAVQQVLKQDLDLEITTQEIEKYIGLTYPLKIGNILKKRNIKADIVDLCKKVRKKYKQTVENEVELIDGALELFELLSKNNFKLGIVSASLSEDVEVLATKTKIRHFFDVLSGRDQVENVKPAPDCYILACKQLGVNPGETVVIEDSVPGVIAAKDAGCKCIAVPYYKIKDQDFSRADIIVNNLKEIDLEKIKRLG